MERFQLETSRRARARSFGVCVLIPGPPSPPVS
jgi:hypothetical protein